MNNIDGTLEHFGIRGMKWGRRKSRTASNAEDTRSDDHKKKIVLKRKKLSDLSNEELKTLNTRLQLERQYKDLTKQDLSPGKQFVRDLFTNSAKQTANNYVSKNMTKNFDELMNLIEN